MKRIIYILTFLASVAGMCVACQYQEIGDADYPLQTIYLPSSIGGIFLVNDTNAVIGTYRYKLDLNSNRLIIPFGVYRAGVHNRGQVKVNISINNDTVNQLISSGEHVSPFGVNLELISPEYYTLPSSVLIPDGKGHAEMNLSIDLDYIASQPNKRLVLAFGIESSEVQANPLMQTTVLELNTNFLVPTAAFKLEFDKRNDRKVILTNNSSYALSCTWNFGDGNTRTTMKDTIHYFYNEYKGYTIQMEVEGITRKSVVKTLPLRVWKNVTSDYIKNAGDPFVRSDLRTQTVGNLKDWVATDNIKALSGGVLYGGFYKNYQFDGVLYPGVMDIYSKAMFSNGKIFQTVALPAGDYRLAFTLVDFRGINSCCFAATKGDTMPDYELMNGTEVLGKFFFDTFHKDTQELFFSLTEQQDVTIGFVVNTQQVPSPLYNDVVIRSVGLYK